MIMLCSSLYLSRIEKSHNHIEDGESGYSLIDYPFPFKFSKFTGFYQKNDLPPVKTILIKCRKGDLNKYSWVIGGIESFPMNYKNIKVVTEDFTISSKYFVVIDLTINPKSSSRFYPLRHSQPNSDLLFLSFYYFKSKMSFNFLDFLNFNSKNYSCRLEIELENSHSETRKFLCLIRAISNLTSLANGNYFYIPFGDFHFKMVNLFPFVLSVFLMKISQRRTKKFNLRNFYRSVILFLICPLSAFFGSDDPILILFYFFVNFRVGFVLSLLLVFQ